MIQHLRNAAVEIGSDVALLFRKVNEGDVSGYGMGSFGLEFIIWRVGIIDLSISIVHGVFPKFHAW
jgi:hypothetical protein